MKLVFAFVTAVLILTTTIDAGQNIVINCTWPCFDGSASCVVTPESASCQIVHGDSWVLNSPKKSPTFTGASVSKVLVSCIPAPNPQLQAVTQDTIITLNQTMIEWPSWALHRPLDAYLGNCGHDLYCSSAGNDANQPVCRKRLSFGSACNSSNQCHAGYCNNNVCHSKNEETKNDDHFHDSNCSDRINSHMSNKTTQILASVFGVVGVIIFAFIGFFMYYRHRRILSNKQDQIYQASNNNFKNSSGSFNINISSLNSNGYKEEQFASDFLHQDSHHLARSPVTVNNNDNQLQAEMLISYNDENNGLIRPPPSYKP
jgi:hypothetical protein